LGTSWLQANIRKSNEIPKNIPEQILLNPKYMVKPLFLCGKFFHAHIFIVISINPFSR